MTFSLYYRDPENNFVELQTDSFGDWELSSNFMHTSPDFAANPIGFFFDCDKLYRAYEAGKNFHALCKSVRSGEFPPDQPPDIGLPV
jgi:catechol 2,3-dioxygenase